MEKISWIDVQETNK